MTPLLRVFESQCRLMTCLSPVNDMIWFLPLLLFKSRESGGGTPSSSVPHLHLLSLSAQFRLVSARAQLVKPEEEEEEVPDKRVEDKSCVPK